MKENIQFGSKNRWLINLTQQVNVLIRLSKILSIFEEKPVSKPHPTTKFICKLRWKDPEVWLWFSHLSLTNPTNTWKTLALHFGVESRSCWSLAFNRCLCLLSSYSSSLKNPQLLNTIRCWIEMAKNIKLPRDRRLKSLSIPTPPQKNTLGRFFSFCCIELRLWNSACEHPEPFNEMMPWSNLSPRDPAVSISTMSWLFSVNMHLKMTKIHPNKACPKQPQPARRDQPLAFLPLICPPSSVTETVFYQNKGWMLAGKCEAD